MFAPTFTSWKLAVDRRRGRVHRYVDEKMLCQPCVMLLWYCCRCAEAIKVDDAIHVDAARTAAALLTRNALGTSGGEVAVNIDRNAHASVVLEHNAGAFQEASGDNHSYKASTAGENRGLHGFGVRTPLTSNFTMTNVTIVGDGKMPREKDQRVSVVSSWVLIHAMGNHTSALKEPELSKLVLGLRDAIADSLEVCRPSVGIVDIRAINIDLMEPDLPRHRVTRVSLVQHWQRVIRNEESYASHVNVTQVKAVYEVRITDEMRVSDAEVARRVDRFQIYGKFSELARLMVRSFARNDRGGMEGVVLDDVGYASRHQLWRPPMEETDVQDCVEEVMLHDTRQVHQYVVAVSLVLVAFITCAGSAVFTIKHPSMIPSRLNPLGNERGVF